MKASGERTIAELRTDALRRMVSAVPTVVDGVEAVARDAQAPARDRVRALEAVARVVFPQAGNDHVSREVAAENARENPPAQIEPAQSEDDERRALLRVPNEWIEARVVETLTEQGDYSEGEARRMLDLWHAGRPTYQVRELFSMIVEEAYSHVLHPDGEPEPEPFGEIEAGDADEIEEISAVSTNGHDVAALVDLLADRGLSISDLVDELTALDVDRDEDG